MVQIILLSLVTFGLLLGGVATRNNFLVVLSLPFFLYLLSGFFNFQAHPDLVIERKLSTVRTTPGEKIKITLTIINRGSRVEQLYVEDILPAKLKVVDGSQLHLLNLESAESYTWSYTIIGQRGYYPLDNLIIETRSILGLSPLRQIYPASDNLAILPKVLNLQRVSIRPHWTRVYSGEIPSRSGGQGTDFFGIRQYQPGDPPNRINWHASARHQSILFSNEFEQDKVSDVGIILDGRESINTISSNVSIFEYSVMAAAALASAFIQQGDRLSLLKYGKFLEWTFPGYGKYQLEQILRALSKAQPGHSLVFSYLEYLPTQIFPPKSQIILVSPLSPDDSDVLLQIRARGYHVLVISPDPVSFESTHLPSTHYTETAARILQLERNQQIARLLQGGVQVLDWNVHHPFEQVFNILQKTSPMIRTMGIIR